MRLTDLMPELVNYAGPGRARRFSDSHSKVDYGEGQEWAMPPDAAESLAHADGIMFLCPTCFQKNGGRVGTESVVLWFAGRPNVPADAKPTARWMVTGTSFEDLTLSPSVNVDNGHWHGFITKGNVT